MFPRTALVLLALVTLAWASCSAEPSSTSTPTSTGSAAGSESTESSSSKAPASTPAETPAKAEKEAPPAPAAEEEKKADSDSGGSSDPIAAMQEFISNSRIDTEKPRWRKSLPMPPKLRFPSDKKFFWNLETTEGDIKIQLMPDVAPMHVSSTVYLTELGYYDGLLFHRVINGFMAQGGCPTGTGRDGPGYKYAGEFADGVRHDRPGLLSMANAGPGTDGSQFFITFVPTPHLNRKHTIFGEVVEGMESVRALEAQGTRSGSPKKQLSIVKATISVE